MLKGVVTSSACGSPPARDGRGGQRPRAHSPRSPAGSRCRRASCRSRPRFPRRAGTPVCGRRGHRRDTTPQRDRATRGRGRRGSARPGAGDRDRANRRGRRTADPLRARRRRETSARRLPIHVRDPFLFQTDELAALDQYRRPSLSDNGLADRGVARGDRARFVPDDRAGKKPAAPGHARRDGKHVGPLVRPQQIGRASEEIDRRRQTRCIRPLDQRLSTSRFGRPSAPNTSGNEATPSTLRSAVRCRKARVSG